MLALIEKMARREGLGDLLGDGVKRAAERIGEEAKELAIHIQGQEVPMHDPRYLPALALSYWLDATRPGTCKGDTGLTTSYLSPGSDWAYLMGKRSTYIQAKRRYIRK